MSWSTSGTTLFPAAGGGRAVATYSAWMVEPGHYQVQARREGKAGPIVEVRRAYRRNRYAVTEREVPDGWSIYFLGQAVCRGLNRTWSLRRAAITSAMEGRL